MMLPIASAAGWQFRIRIRSKHGRTDQRKAEESQQQDCQDAAHHPQVYSLHESFPISGLWAGRETVQRAHGIPSLISSISFPSMPRLGTGWPDGLQLSLKA